MRVLIIAVVFAILLGARAAARAEGKVNLSREEDLELERQLKLLNKPPVKTFKSKDGDIVDCIGIYKQPAFDHPLLKNHKLQLRPSYFPTGIRRRRGNDQPHVRQVRRHWPRCPPGTIPLRRTRKQDLIMARSVLDIYAARPGWSTSAPPPGVHIKILNNGHFNPTAETLIICVNVCTVNGPFHLLLQGVRTSFLKLWNLEQLLMDGIMKMVWQFAGVSTPNDGTQKFYGATTALSVFNLTLTGKQTTAASLWLGTGVEGPFSSLEYGWTVNQQLYGDTATRTFSLWTADGFQKTRCFNALCPGYVQVSQKRIMGEVNHPVSIYGEDIYKMEFLFHKDNKTGNWWLLEHIAESSNEPVGYWPKELFPSMAEYATIAQFGGKVYSPPDIPTKTPMGTGHFVPNDFKRTCFSSEIGFVDSQSGYFDPEGLTMAVLADTPDIYKADYLGDISKEYPQKGYTLVFGGPQIEGYN
ncbi:hypothetical protein Ancab_010142 [Ancistrocladus abbreviatus]